MMCHCFDKFVTMSWWIPVYFHMFVALSQYYWYHYLHVILDLAFPNYVIFHLRCDDNIINSVHLMSLFWFFHSIWWGVYLTLVQSCIHDLSWCEVNYQVIYDTLHEPIIVHDGTRLRHSAGNTLQFGIETNGYILWHGVGFDFPVPEICAIRGWTHPLLP